MHQPLDQPRASLYYPYRVHEPWLASRHGQQARHPVVIAGAGPAGLVTALELARHGVRSVVLNAERQVSEGSRAIVFTRRTMEILQQVGVADRVTAAGLPWRYGTSFYRNQPVFRMEAPHDDDERFFPMTNLQQQFLEEYLLEACAASGLVELRWGNRVARVEPHPDLVRVEVDTPEGPYTLEAQWLVAADGGRSGIRSQLGLSMEGASYEGLFVIADIRIDLPLSTERRAWFDPDWNRGNTILMHREPLGIWRIDYQLPEGESPEQALAPDALRARIDSQLAMIGFGGTLWELDWSSVYSARTLTLPHYRHGRVLFAGDAAHLLPIFGVRGANTAFQDAQALGWQLAFVLRGLASARLLDSYSAERVGAAREIIAEAGRSTRFMTPPAGGFRLLRDAVLSLSLTQDFVRPLFHWRTSRPHAYVGSMLNSPHDDDARFADGPGHGAPPRNAALGPEGFLLDHLGGGFDLLLFGPGPAVAPDLLAVISEQRALGVPIRVIAIGEPQPVPGADLTLADAEGRCRLRWGAIAPGNACLLRPDQHLCARWLALDGQRLRSALETALPR